MTVITVPLDYNKFRIAMVNTLTKATGCVCIVAEPETQNVPRPKKPYFSLKIMGPGVKQGDDSARQIPNTSKWERSGQRKITVDFNCFGNSHEEAYSFMALWQASLETELVQAELRAAGIAVWLNGNVADLSVLLNTGYEGRAQMDVRFGAVSTLIEDWSYIEEVRITGTVTTDQGVDDNIAVQVTAP
jgi:hypothetical protein